MNSLFESDGLLNECLQCVVPVDERLVPPRFRLVVISFSLVLDRQHDDVIIDDFRRRAAGTWVQPALWPRDLDLVTSLLKVMTYILPALWPRDLDPCAEGHGGDHVTWRHQEHDDAQSGRCDRTDDENVNDNDNGNSESQILNRHGIHWEPKRKISCRFVALLVRNP